MPSWNAFNSVITEECIPQKIVGFLPVLPYPVTQHSTVYTALKNFQNVLQQLNQQHHLPIFCDEGVYQIAKEIQLLRPDEFKNIVLCLGPFHMIKIALACLGKYLEGSGAQNIFVENFVFGLNVVEKVMNGSHYKRSMYGMALFAEAMERLQLFEFFKEIKIVKFNDIISCLQKLKSNVAEKNTESSRDDMLHFHTLAPVLMSQYLIEFFFGGVDTVREV